MSEQLRDLMTRLADEAGTTTTDPTLWRRAQRSRQRRRRGAVAAVAAVLAVGVGTVVGTDGFGRPSTSGDVVAPDPSPPRPAVGPLDPTTGNLGDLLVPGTYTVPLDAAGLGEVTVELPEDFYWVPWGGFVRGPDPELYGVGFWDGEALLVNTQRCAGEDRPFVRPGPTARDLASALAGGRGRRATEPVPVSLGGHDGVYLELTLPADPPCQPTAIWALDPRRGPSLDHLEPGTVDRFWILEVNGRRLVIDAFTFPGVAAEQVEVLTDIVESIAITAPGQSP